MVDIEITKEQRDVIKSQLSEMGKLMAAEAIAELKDLIASGKSARVEELIRDISAVKAQAVMATTENKPLYAELLADKLASLEHVLDSERILKEKEFKAIFVRASKTLFIGLGVIGQTLIKTAVKGAVKGAIGGALGGLGETIIEKAVDKLGDSLSPS